jgi:hypothetical protein
VCSHRLSIEVENYRNPLVGNRQLEANGLPKEAAASGHDVTSLGASIEGLFGLVHRAKRADLIQYRVMKTRTGVLDFVLGLKKLEMSINGFMDMFFFELYTESRGTPSEGQLCFVDCSFESSIAFRLPRQ